MLIFRNAGIRNHKSNSLFSNSLLALTPNEETASHEGFQIASAFFLFIIFPSIPIEE